MFAPVTTNDNYYEKSVSATHQNGEMCVCRREIYQTTRCILETAISRIHEIQQDRKPVTLK